MRWTFFAPSSKVQVVVEGEHQSGQGGPQGRPLVEAGAGDPVLEGQQHHRGHEGGTDHRQHRVGGVDDGGQAQVADGAADDGQQEDAGAVGQAAFGHLLKVGGGGAEESDGGGEAGQGDHDGQNHYSGLAQQLLGDGHNEGGPVQDRCQRRCWWWRPGR